MGRQRLDGTARGHGPGGKPAHADEPVIHDDHAGGGDVDAELRRDLDHELATLNELGGERPALGPRDIGRATGMAERGKLDRPI